jgi:hypothetical protein
LIRLRDSESSTTVSPWLMNPGSENQSWQMLTAISCDLQCCTGAGVRADAQFGNSADGTIAIVSDCGSFTCSVGYAGAMTR